MKPKINLLRQIGVVVAVIATIVVSYLANAMPFNGQTTGEIAAQFDVLFMPADYVFGIWGLIYFGLVAYAIYQVQPALRDDKRLRSLDMPFFLASLTNMSWLLLWHHGQFIATFVVMLVLLGSLVKIYHRLAPERPFVPTARRWAVHYTFSVYLGWIMIATVANLAVMLASLHWNGLGVPELFWFTLAVMAVLLSAATIAWVHADVPLLLTLVWAFIGIGVAHQMDPLVAAVAWLGTAALAVMIALATIREPIDTLPNPQ